MSLRVIAMATAARLLSSAAPVPAVGRRHDLAGASLTPRAVLAPQRRDSGSARPVRARGSCATQHSSVGHDLSARAAHSPRTTRFAQACLSVFKPDNTAHRLDRH